MQGLTIAELRIDPDIMRRIWSKAIMNLRKCFAELEEKQIHIMVCGTLGRKRSTHVGTIDLLQDYHLSNVEKSRGLLEEFLHEFRIRNFHDKEEEKLTGLENNFSISKSVLTSRSHLTTKDALCVEGNDGWFSLENRWEVDGMARNQRPYKARTSARLHLCEAKDLGKIKKAEMVKRLSIILHVDYSNRGMILLKNYLCGKVALHDWGNTYFTHTGRNCKLNNYLDVDNSETGGTSMFCRRDGTPVKKAA